MENSFSEELTSSLRVGASLPLSLPGVLHNVQIRDGLTPQRNSSHLLYVILLERLSLLTQRAFSHGEKKGKTQTAKCNKQNKKGVKIKSCERKECDSIDFVFGIVEMSLGRLPKELNLNGIFKNELKFARSENMAFQNMDQPMQ